LNGTAAPVNLPPRPLCIAAVCAEQEAELIEWADAYATAAVLAIVQRGQMRNRWRG